MFQLLFKIWELLARIALLITKIDELKTEFADLWQWLFGDDEEEPESK